MTSSAAERTSSAPTSSSTAPADPVRGRFGPLVHLSRFDLAAPELTWQLPVNGELYRLMPGSDRPDYSLMVLSRPLHFYVPSGFDIERVDPGQRVPDRKGRPMVRVHALVVCARFVGQQLHPGMLDVPVNIAFVIDNSLARDETVDFAKIEYAGAGFLSEGHAGANRPAATQAAADGQGGSGPSARAQTPPRVPTPVPTPEPAADPTAVPAPAAGPTSGPAAADPPGADVAREAAAVLRRGIEDRRGAAISRLGATFALGESLQLTGLTGNADGSAPEPNEETFAELNSVFAKLGKDPQTAGIRQIRVRLGDEIEDIEVALG